MLCTLPLTSNIGWSLLFIGYAQCVVINLSDGPALGIGFSQEAAMRIGYGAAALPLWEEFCQRFFQYETQLGPIIPRDDISAHLAQLAQLYEASSAVLSNIYALLSPLSAESLPGKAFWCAEMRICLKMSIY